MANGNSDLDNTDSAYGGALRIASTLKSVVDAKASIVLFSRELGYENNSALRELYLTKDWGWLNLTLGRKIVAWGRADVINPTDNLSPKLFRSVITDPEERRLGTDMLALDVIAGSDYSINLTWAPKLAASSIPKGEILAFADINTAPKSTRDTYAVKVDYSHDSVDSSLSYLQGESTLPVFNFLNGQLRSFRPEVDTFGADFSWQINEYYGLRGEAAKTAIHYNEPNTAALPSNFSQYVIGIERQLSDGWLIVSQYLQKDTDLLSPLAPEMLALQQLNQSVWFQFSDIDQGLMVGINRSDLVGDFSAKFGAIYGLSKDDSALLLSGKWQANPSLSLRFNIEYYSGQENSNLGSLHDNRIAVFEIRKSLQW